MARWKYRVTVVAALVGMIRVALFELFGLDSLDYIVAFLTKVKRLRMHDVIAFVFILVVGLSIDLAIANRKHARRAKLQELDRQEEMRERARHVEMQELTRQTEIQEQRLLVLRATMRIVQHIVNNFLNHLQLFRLDAEDLVDESSLKQLDTLSHELAAELTSLGNLDQTPERESCVGLMIDCEATRALS